MIALLGRAGRKGPGCRQGMFGALRSGWSIPVSQHRTAMLRRVLGGSSRGELHNIVGGHPAVLPRTLERVPQACLSPRHGIPRAAARSMHVRMARVKRQAVTQGVSNTAGSVNRPRSFVQRWVFTVAVGTAALKTQLADLIVRRRSLGLVTTRVAALVIETILCHRLRWGLRGHRGAR